MLLTLVVIVWYNMIRLGEVWVRLHKYHHVALSWLQIVRSSKKYSVYEGLCT